MTSSQQIVTHQIATDCADYSPRPRSRFLPFILSLSRGMTSQRWQSQSIHIKCYLRINWRWSTCAYSTEKRVFSLQYLGLSSTVIHASTTTIAWYLVILSLYVRVSLNWVILSMYVRVFHKSGWEACLVYFKAASAQTFLSKLVLANFNAN